MKLLFIGLALFISSGCSSLSEQGMKVQFVWDQDDVQGCTFRGGVDAYSSWGGVLYQSAGEEDAKLMLRNKAGNLGANKILLSHATGSFFGAKASGRAYYCQEE